MVELAADGDSKLVRTSIFLRMIILFIGFLRK
jgi:hypothetical protein